MIKNSVADFVIAIIITISATILAVMRYTDGKTVDGILWSIVAFATLLREILKYLKNRK